MANKYPRGSRSYTMSRIKSKDTKPELLVRHFLYSRGYRYRKNVKGLPGTPDIVLRKYGIVILIHGCFWHGHKLDGHIPHSNSEFWEAKIERNKKRDARDKEELKKRGWKVMTIWGCQLKPLVREQTLNEIIYLINKSYLDHYRSKIAQPYVTNTNENAPSIAAEDIEKYIKSQ